MLTTEPARRGNPSQGDSPCDSNGSARNESRKRFTGARRRMRCRRCPTSRPQRNPAASLSPLVWASPSRAIAVPTGRGARSRQARTVASAIAPGGLFGAPTQTVAPAAAGEARPTRARPAEAAFPLAGPTVSLCSALPLDSLGGSTGPQNAQESLIATTRSVIPRRMPL